jgi:polyferredoxin
LARYWVNAAVIIILFALPTFHIIKFDILNNVTYVFGNESDWVRTTTVFLGFWAGSYVITLTADYIYGRLFCGWICSWGSILKALRNAGNTVKRKKLSPIVTEAATFGAAILSTIGLFNWFTDLAVLFHPSHSAFAPFVVTVGVTTIIAFVMLRYVGLKFCQKYCPIGWYLGVLSQQQRMRIDFEPANCTLGEVCVHDCPMALDPRLLAMDTDADSHSQCVLCFDCLSSCNACAAKVPGTKPLTIGLSERPVLQVDLDGILKQMATEKEEQRKAKRAIRSTPTSPVLAVVKEKNSVEAD